LAGHLRVVRDGGHAATTTNVQHQPWCEDHTPGQCTGGAVDVAPSVAVWLTQTDLGTRLVVDGPMSGIELNLDEVLDLSDAVRRLYDVAVSR